MVRYLCPVLSKFSMRLVRVSHGTRATKFRAKLNVTAVARHKLNLVPTGTKFSSKFSIRVVRS